MPFTQQGRLISIATPLGEDKLLLTAFTGHEAISRLFTFQLDLLTEQGPIAFADIVGKSVTITVNQSDNTPRYFNAIVSRFIASGADTTFMYYKMEVVPWTWKLTRYADCFIFHNKSVPDIIQAVFEKRGLTDFLISTTATYQPLEYCVQYRETDFNFISRLMEQNGIFYFFKHEEGKHTMVVADAPSAHEDCPGFANAGFNLVAGALDEEDTVGSWNLEQELRTGNYALTDYNFKTPSNTLLATEPTIFTIGDNASFELFDYPGDYQTRDEGATFAKLRMQEEEAGHLVAHGGSVCRAFTSGYKFNLTDHPDDAMNAPYVLTEIQHEASVAGNYNTGYGSSDHYANHFTCIPDSVPFRPARLTPKPFVQGPQTAVVVGKSQDQDSTASDDDAGSGTEDIWVDKYGRVVVLFPWDRAGACSCRVRVSQDWAGQGWGMINIPRIGQEVLVSFLEGDPDRPIITGRVYNAEQTVPYTLPDNQTRTTFKTHSTPNGGDDNYNELRFEDKKGAEQIYIQAERDLDIRVKTDARKWVGDNDSLIVGNDRMEKIGRDTSRMVGRDQTESIGRDVHISVGRDRVEKIGHNLDCTIKNDQGVSIGNDFLRIVGGDLNEKVKGSETRKIKQDKVEKITQNYAVEVGQSIYIKGMQIVIEADAQLSLKVGGNFVDLNPAGVFINGSMVFINSGGAAGSGSSNDPEDPDEPADPNQPVEPEVSDDGSVGDKLN